MTAAASPAKKYPGPEHSVTVENAKLAQKSKDYLRNGCRLLERTTISGMRIDHITTEDVNALSFSGSAYNVNCALKTLRRMLNLAQEWG